MLAVQELAAGYGKVTIVEDIALQVNNGEVVSVIGRNGVGKSTLLKALMGILKAQRGMIIFNDNDITKVESFKRAQLGIGYVPQGRGVFPRLTVAENLEVGKLINAKRGDKNIDWIYEYFPNLHARRNQKAGTMSGGEQSMLVLGRALVGKPDLLILDEPSEGIQPTIVQKIGEIVCQINGEYGLTVLFVEQNVGLIQQMAHRCYVMDNGRIVCELGRDKMLEREVIKSYLAV